MLNWLGKGVREKIERDKRNTKSQEDKPKRGSLLRYSSAGDDFRDAVRNTKKR